MGRNWREPVQDYGDARGPGAHDAQGEAGAAGLAWLGGKGATQEQPANT